MCESLPRRISDGHLPVISIQHIIIALASTEDHSRVSTFHAPLLLQFCVNFHSPHNSIPPGPNTHQWVLSSPPGLRISSILSDQFSFVSVYEG